VSRVATFAAATLALTMAFGGHQIVLARSKAKMSKTKEVLWPAEKVQYKEVIPGVVKAILWGNDKKGPYGALTRFKAGTSHALHTHSNDLKLIVISGHYIYGKEGEAPVALGPGSYLLEPGGTRHTSGCDKDADVLFFESSNKGFDIHFVEEPKKK
jgi:quercetin dioxygenase-like cupin family protein